MFFSEIYGFSAMISFAKGSDYFLLIIVNIIILLLLLSIIFYKFVNVYQMMKYEGKERQKKVYFGEIAALALFALCIVFLMLPSSLKYLRGIV